ncbi:MAG: ribosome-associated translation inhibitor RaiA [Phycisphaeraceae bacterium]|nr:MAG: ribosome-associated translation inhibitor RaiA [Phycisphaeraceae bacterium]
MRIDVVGRNIEVTDAIRTHAVGKVEKLTKYYDAIQQIVVTLAKEDRHHTGDFGVEIRIDVERHEDFIVNAKGPDLYAVIDDAVHKGVRQLTDHKERLKPGHHRTGG